MNELSLEHLLNKIGANQFSVADLNIIQQLTRKPKYEMMIKRLMMNELNYEYQRVTAFLK